MALTTELRLKRRSDFKRLQHPEAVFPSEYLVLKCARCENGQAKFGFAVPKRLAKAIIRNRARRILSEWVRTNNKEFPEGYIWLIIVKKMPKSKSKLSKALRDDIRKLARKASRELKT